MPLPSGHRVGIGDGRGTLVIKCVVPASGFRFRSREVTLGSIEGDASRGTRMPPSMKVFIWTSTKGYGSGGHSIPQLQNQEEPKMKRFSKFAIACTAVLFAVLAAPIASTPAAAAPAATTVDLMRTLQGANASPVEQVHYRRRGHRHWRHRHWRHRDHCRLVKRCWRNHWGHRKCRWVRRCW